MAAFNSHDFTNASVETDSYDNRVTTYGIAGLGMLFTAYYSAPNTLTLQFSSYDPAVLAAASSTGAKYTIAGPSAPTVTSVTFTPGGRTVTLNLSGALVSPNTYTLALADWTVSNGEQPNFSGLVVDIILPTLLAAGGVGISVSVDLGSPSAQNAGTAQMVGIGQAATLGTPVVTAPANAVGVGLAQAAALGTPVAGLFDVVTGVGFAQVIAVGTPVMNTQLEPLGVGIAQVVALGTPAADINPLTPVGVGVAQNIGVGTPVAGGSGNVHGVGISQTVALGTPVAALVDKFVVGIGIAQLIDFTNPPMVTLTSPGQSAFGVGLVQGIALGVPLIARFFPARFTTVPDLDLSIVQRWAMRALLDGAVHLETSVEQPLRLSTSVDEAV
jgi:hypothetical protein